MFYPVESLGTQKSPGLPINILKLRVGLSIMLLRDINPVNDQVTSKSISSKCIRWYYTFVVLPSKYPFESKKVQFPIKLGFAIIINKAQEQTRKVRVVKSEAESNNGFLLKLFDSASNEK